MSHRNSRHPSSPRPYRGRENFVDVNQAAAEFFIRLGDPRDRYFGSPNQYIGAPLPFPEYECYDPQDIYYSGDFRPGDSGGVLQALKPIQRNPRPREDMAGKGEDKEQFSKAMKRLFKELAEAETVYGDHQTAFDNDTTEIKKYAGDDSLGVLWKKKWAGKNGDSDGENAQEATEVFSQTHADLKQKLEMALQEATLSKFTPGQDARRTPIQIENAKRLQEKVVTASKQIIDLLGNVSLHRDYSLSLLNELVLLKTLIDPELDANKSLYRPGAGVGAGDSAGAGNGDGQQQAPAGGESWN
ncbi:hypothetical protein VTL71DRAFT_1158 [Oculimacula yallundae]|uniref:Uncharacterized protein n=1 Tax=Oculimacula yallundae TaxID=86028 RepID=A0ABR4D278_9HELO